jgi:hypothetical protein
MSSPITPVGSIPRPAAPAGLAPAASVPSPAAPELMAPAASIPTPAAPAAITSQGETTPASYTIGGTLSDFVNPVVIPNLVFTFDNGTKMRWSYPFNEGDADSFPTQYFLEMVKASSEATLTKFVDGVAVVQWIAPGDDEQFPHQLNWVASAQAETTGTPILTPGTIAPSPITP